MGIDEMFTVEKVERIRCGLSPELQFIVPLCLCTCVCTHPCAIYHLSLYIRNYEVFAGFERFDMITSN